MSIIASLITNPRTGRGVFLQQSVSSEHVPYSYYRVPLQILSFKVGINIIDIVGSKVIWAYQTKKDWTVGGMTRVSKLVIRKGKRGFWVKGKFIKI